MPANADTGTTGHFLSLADAKHLVLDLQPAVRPISVALPNGDVMQSSHVTVLNIPHLPPEACIAHIFPAMDKSSPLLSIGTLCDHGCIATYTADTVTISKNNVPILHGHRSPTSKLWMIDLADTAGHMAANLIRHQTNAERVASFHAALGSPAASTMLAAMNKNYFSFPALTPAMVTKNLPNSLATSKGHLDQSRQGIQSSQKPTTMEPLSPKTEGGRHNDKPDPALQRTEGESDTESSETHEDLFPPSPLTSKTCIVTTQVFEPSKNITGQSFHDFPGAFPLASHSGKKNMLVCYNEDSNYIHIEVLTDRSGPSYVDAYSKAFDFFVKAGFTPRFEKMDNEAPRALVNWCQTHQVNVQLAPPNIHRTNKAERAIRTFKNHFIAGLSTTSKDFPLDAWDELIDQMELTVNLLRGSNVNPYVSAWQQIHGPYEYARNPIAPAGTRVLIFERPEKRASWSGTWALSTWIKPDKSESLIQLHGIPIPSSYLDQAHWKSLPPPLKT